jgi:peptidoglycan hydrolase-like protein with peptidoglycan-binding domain
VHTTRPMALMALLASAVLAMTACEPVDLIGVTAEPPTATTTEPTASTRPAPSQKPATSPQPTDKSTPKPTDKPAKKTETAGPSALMSKGDTGMQVRELQHRLHQLAWFSGDITGNYGQTTVEAVRGFQAKRKLRETGAVDSATWATLVKMTRKPTADELNGKLTPGPALMKLGSSGDRVRDLQARLRQIGWYEGKVTGSYGRETVTSVEGFQRRRGLPVTGEVDQRTWDRLLSMTHTPTSAELTNVLAKPKETGLDARCLTGRALCISKRTNTLVWVIDGKPQIRMDVRFGSYETPTREGAFSIGWKSPNHVSTIYHTPMPYAMFFSGGQAVHYSADFAARGYAGASHGCVNVRNLSAITSLYNQVAVGDKVIVYT